MPPPQDLLAAIAGSRERHRPVETVLIERYQVSKQEIGCASTFYQCPFVEYDDKRQLLPALLQVSIQAISKRITQIAAAGTAKHSVDVLSR